MPFTPGNEAAGVLLKVTLVAPIRVAIAIFGATNSESSQFWAVAGIDTGVCGGLSPTCTHQPPSVIPCQKQPFLYWFLSTDLGGTNQHEIDAESYSHRDL